MTGKRFFKKEYAYDWWFVFDREQEYVEDMKIPFKTDYGNLIAMSEDQVINELNELNDKNRKLNKFNQRLMKANNELSEDVDYYKSKSASCEQGLIHNEKELHQYKQKVQETLQKAYNRSNEGIVYHLDLAGHKYIGQQQRIAILKLLKDIAKDLGVELND